MLVTIITWTLYLRFTVGMIMVIIFSAQIDWKGIADGNYNEKITKEEKIRIALKIINKEKLNKKEKEISIMMSMMHAVKGVFVTSVLLLILMLIV